MAIFKQVWVYTLGANSWTEVYYINESSLTAASTFPYNFLQNRLKMLHQDAQLVAIRVSDVQNLRSSLPVPLNLPGGYTGTDGPDVTNTAAVIKLGNAAIPTSRSIWLAGLPDSYVTRNPTNAQDVQPPAFASALLVWIANLVNNNYQIRYLTKIAIPAVAPNNYTSITSVNGAPGTGITTLTLAAGYTAAANNRVIISQASPKLLPGLNGHWQSTFINPTTITIPYNMPQTGPLNITKGRLRQEAYNYAPIQFAASGFQFYRSRQRGKNFLAGRGRKSGVRLRSL
jgi:hypothetical protein